MSAYLYDEAIVNDLRKIVGDNRIHIMPVDRVYDIIPTLDNDQIVLPLITLSRTGWSIRVDEANHSAKYEGAMARINKFSSQFESTRIQKIQFIPMRIDYSIDVWTRTRAENDNIVRELFWYYTISPTSTITVPYNLDIDHNFNIFLSDNIEDNSDVAQHAYKGELYRQTIHIYTDDAKLWKSTERDPTTVELKVKLRQQNIIEASRDMSSADSSDIQ